MKTSTAERERLRGLLAEAQDTTIGSDVRTVRYMLLDHAAVNALPGLLDDLAEAETVVRDLLFNGGPTPSKTSCGHAFFCICPEQQARAYLSERKQTPPADGDGMA